MSVNDLSLMWVTMAIVVHTSFVKQLCIQCVPGNVSPRGRTAEETFLEKTKRSLALETSFSEVLRHSVVTD